MILLDTNYLIRSLIAGTPEAERVDSWLDDAEPLCTAGVCWYEFHSGPVDDEAVSLIRGVLQERILPFTNETAVEAARLFNAAGRPRRLRVDAMIAATALLADARLATGNTEEFRLFAAEGLELV